MDPSVTSHSCTQSEISSEDNDSSFVLDFGMHMTVPWSAPLGHNHYINSLQEQPLYHNHHGTTTSAPAPFVSPSPASLLTIPQLSAGEENSMPFFAESDFIYPPESISSSLVATAAAAAAAAEYDVQMCTSPPQVQAYSAAMFLPMVDFSSLSPVAGNSQPVLTNHSFFPSALEMAGPEQPLATPFLDNASIVSCDSDTSHHVAEQQQQQQQQQPLFSHTTTNTGSVEATHSFADWERQARYPTWRLIQPHRRAYRRRRDPRRGQQQPQQVSATGTDEVSWDLSSTGPEPQLAAPAAGGFKPLYHTTDDDEASSSCSADRPQCPECGAFFSRQRDLARHRQTTHSSNRLHCRFCSKSYTRNDSRMRHERQCAGSSSRMASSSSSSSSSSRASCANKQPSPTTTSTAISSSSSSASSSPTLSMA